MPVFAPFGYNQGICLSNLSSNLIFQIFSFQFLKRSLVEVRFSVPVCGPPLRDPDFDLATILTNAGFKLETGPLSIFELFEDWNLIHIRTRIAI